MERDPSSGGEYGTFDTPFTQEKIPILPEQQSTKEKSDIPRGSHERRSIPQQEINARNEILASQTAQHGVVMQRNEEGKFFIVNPLGIILNPVIERFKEQSTVQGVLPKVIAELKKQDPEYRRENLTTKIAWNIRHLFKEREVDMRVPTVAQRIKNMEYLQSILSGEAIAEDDADTAMFQRIRRLAEDAHKDVLICGALTYGVIFPIELILLRLNPFLAGGFLLYDFFPPTGWILGGFGGLASTAYLVGRRFLWDSVISPMVSHSQERIDRRRAFVYSFSSLFWNGWLNAGSSSLSRDPYLRAYAHEMRLYRLHAGAEVLQDRVDWVKNLFIQSYYRAIGHRERRKDKLTS